MRIPMWTLTAVAWLALPALAADPAPPATDIPPLIAGQSLKLIQTQTLIRPSSNGPVTVVSEVPIEITVVSTAARATAIRWSRGTVKLTDIDAAGVGKDPKLKESMMKLVAQQMGPTLAALDNLTLDLSFDDQMNFVGLKNLDDVEAAVRKTFDALDAFRSGQGLPPIGDDVKRSVSSRGVLERVVPKEALTYLAWGAMRVRRGQSITIDTLMPNPLGGDATPATTNATLNADPDATGRFVLDVRTSVDADRFVASLKKTLERTPGATPLTPGHEQELRGIEIAVTAQFRIDPKAGLATDATSKTTTKQGDRLSSEQSSWKPAAKG